MTLAERLFSSFDAIAWLEFLIGMSLAAIIVVPLTFVVADVLLRTASAATRHLLWLVAIFSILVGLGLSAMSSDGLLHVESDFLVTQIQNAPEAAQVEAKPQQQQQLQQTLALSDGSLLEHLTISDLESPKEFDQPNVALFGAADQSVTIKSAKSPVPTPETTQSISTETHVRPWLKVAVVVWGILGAVSILFVVGAQGLMMIRRRRYQPVTDQSLMRRIKDVVSEVSVRRRVTLLQSDSNQMPMTWGVFCPVLLLPASAGEWSDERLQMVLLHELAHVRRFDCLWQIVSALVVGFHWFNPLVWFAAKRLRDECERACDDAVLASGVPASSYAEQLLDLSTGGRRGVLAMCARLAMARSHRLTGRLQAIVDESRDRRPLSRQSKGAAVFFGMSCLAAVVPFTGVRVGAVDESSPSGRQQEAKSSQHQNWVRDLSGGAKVELIGVGEFPTQTTRRWWSPEGQTLDERPYDRLDGSFQIKGGHIRREFAFRFVGMNNVSFDISFDPTNGHDALNPPVTNGWHSENIRAVSAVFDPSREQTSVELQCAYGKWVDTVAFTGDSDGTFMKPVDGIDVRVATTRGYEEGPRSFETRKTSVITLTHELIEYDSRVIAITRDDKRITAAKIGQLSGETFLQLTSRFRNLPLDDIREFLLQIRPRETARFENVALLPQNAAQVSKDAALSAKSTKQTSVNTHDMQFVEEGRRRLAKIRFPVQEFTFVRVKYSSAGRGASWATDYPDADKALSKRLDEWTSMKVNRDGLVKSLTDDDLGKYPFLYVSEPGSMLLSDEEVVALRKYLSSGGFLMADDFWGEAEWKNLQIQMTRVFPDFYTREIEDNRRVFRWPFALPEKPQVCSIGAALAGRKYGITWERDDGREPRYWQLVTDNRLVAIFCQNTDLADGWERQDDSEWYAREFSERRAYPMMMNIVTSAMMARNPKRPGQVEIQHRRDPASGGEQRIHPAVAKSPTWLDLRRRLESSGVKYCSVDVSVAPRSVAEAAKVSENSQEPEQEGPATFISLRLSGTPTADLTPLETLSVLGTKVSDLTPLSWARLKSLSAGATEVTDVAPLAG